MGRNGVWTLEDIADLAPGLSQEQIGEMWVILDRQGREKSIMGRGIPLRL